MDKFLRNIGKLLIASIVVLILGVATGQVKVSYECTVCEKTE